MNKYFIFLFICITKLYASEQPKTVVIPKKKCPTIEQASRTLISRIRLLKCYKETRNPQYKPKELDNLNKIVALKIRDELDIFQKYQSQTAKDFLVIANQNNLLTLEQKILFEQLTYTPPTKPTIFKVMAFCSVIIIFFILKNIYNI